MAAVDHPGRSRSGNTPNQVAVPCHENRVVAWRQEFRGGSDEDRKLREVAVSLPPKIERLSPVIPPKLAARMDETLREIAALDETHGEHLGPMSTLLLRAESVASSKIEHVDASMNDYARALHGVRSNPSATSMVASTRALADLIATVDGGTAITLDNILRAHGILMADDQSERVYAGRLRDMQNWIGGSDYSPRAALYVPPPPATVRDYLDDLTAFANRDDVTVLAQAAITHAQFESVHPFTDGNGRIGRALINTVLRRRRVTRRVVVPLASALVARRDDYFDVLAAYRDGDAGPIISAFSTASTISSVESRVTADRVAAMPEKWRDMAGRPRAGSAAATLLNGLLDNPVFAADDVLDLIGGAPSSVYAGIARLQDAGVVRPLNDRVRNQVWVAAELADELDDLGVRIAAMARKS